jgi:hypothetical protein
MSTEDGPAEIRFQVARAPHPGEERPPDGGEHFVWWYDDPQGPGYLMLGEATYPPYSQEYLLWEPELLVKVQGDPEWQRFIDIGVVKILA